MDSIAGGPSRGPDAGEGFAHPADHPIFVFAQPRSGSTLVQRLVNSLEDVILYAADEECDAGPELAAQIQRATAQEPGNDGCRAGGEPGANRHRPVSIEGDASGERDGRRYQRLRATMRGGIRRDFVRRVRHRSAGDSAARRRRMRNCLRCSHHTAEESAVKDVSRAQ